QPRHLGLRSAQRGIHVLLALQGTRQLGADCMADGGKFRDADPLNAAVVAPRQSRMRTGDSFVHEAREGRGVAIAGCIVGRL
ncbi:hypothetical protein NK983_33370, partial [Salmonella enterica subsp. enterica serovar Typhimurium]|nr:hypothetical protein [Salmonella enterica subsp. enterica serovar Typhimurium]